MLCFNFMKKVTILDLATKRIININTHDTHFHYYLLLFLTLLYHIYTTVHTIQYRTVQVIISNSILKSLS